MSSRASIRHPFLKQARNGDYDWIYAKYNPKYIKIVYQGGNYIVDRNLTIHGPILTTDVSSKFNHALRDLEFYYRRYVNYELNICEKVICKLCDPEMHVKPIVELVQSEPSFDEFSFDSE